ncbi:hypothetical protein MNBD_GAMMA15-1402 [hydrothermal vent metagenome]|uniref:STAS domain-containing protein n=1 Tax=hydrothermal vent metagenome TaxID=652676 RepID=A0A3B0YUK7_9ZZZZ
MTQSEHENGTHEDAVQLPAELTIAQSGEFYQKFETLIEQGKNITLDAGVVTRIDTAFIQLLFQVQRTLAETSHGLQWVNTSETIRRSVELLGMSEQLNLAEAG